MTDLNDLLVTSPDLNEERLETLKQLFPDLFTSEGKLNPAELKRLFEDEATTNKEQYTFTWRGKGKAKKHAFTPSRAALTYDPERSVNPDKANGNMIIEGENLEVLKLLTSAYREQVKCIYIDPPYNTGGDFIYPDNYTKEKKEYWEEGGSYREGVKLDTNPETSGRYHSDWLSMMYSRLLIARQLLRDDGVIFASIDDNEIHNLRRLMDEVFGEENFIACIANISNPKGRSDDAYVATAHEYILIYKKYNAILGLWAPEEKVVRRYRKTSENSKKYREMDLRKTGDGDRREDRENMFYPFFYNEKKGELLVGNPANLEEEKDGYVKILPLRGDGTYGRWRWGAETSQKLVDKLFAKLMPARQVWSVFEFDYLEDKEGVKPTSAWTHKDVNSERGSEQFIKLGFDKEVFPRPKPVGTIKRILQIATTTNADDIVLDFFSGSGTTAQAVIEQNGEDGGKRKFILIQLPEAIDSKQKAFEFGFSTISQITIERNKRVIEGYGDDPQPLDTGFKVYRLTKSYFPRAEFQPDPDKSNEENVALLKQYIAEKEASFHMAFEQDQVFDEVLLKHGFKLDYKLTEQEEFSKNAVYLVEESDRKAYICLDTNIAEETIDFFKTHTGTMFICLERALDTTKKWNLNHALGERLKAL